MRRAGVGARPARIVRFSDVAIDAGTRTVRKGDHVVALTPMEFNLLFGPRQASGAVVSRLDLLKEVWGHAATVLTRTVDTHVAELRRKLEDDPSQPLLSQLDTALERRTVTDVRTELEGIVRELYERTERTRESATVITRSAADLPELFKLFYVQVRRDVIARMTRYVHLRIEAKHFAPDLDPAVAARYILETVTMFGRHRYADRDPQPLDDTAVRETVVRLIVRGLVPDPEGHPDRRVTFARTR